MTWKAGLHHLAGEPQRWPYEAYASRRGFIPLISALDGGRGGDAIEVGNSVVRSPGQLADASVVATANEVWVDWESGAALAHRGRGPSELRVWAGVDWDPEIVSNPPAVVHVPTAYVVKLVDFEHAECRLVEGEVVWPLLLEMPAPDWLNQQRPDSPLPLGVGIAAVLGVILAFFLVLGTQGRRRERRRGLRSGRGPPGTAGASEPVGQ